MHAVAGRSNAAVLQEEIVAEKLRAIAAGVSAANAAGQSMATADGWELKAILAEDAEDSGDIAEGGDGEDCRDRVDPS